MATNFSQLIRNWHENGKTVDYFSAYMFEYMSFTGYLKRFKFKEANKDRTAIQHLKRDTTYKNQYLEKINSNPELQQAWQKIKKELDRAPLGDMHPNVDEASINRWWNFSGDDLKQKIPATGYFETGVIRDLNDWENMVEFWHTIRNNLFHGAKDPQDERDQLVVENGYKTLHSLVELFLSDQ